MTPEQGLQKLQHSGVDRVRRFSDVGAALTYVGELYDCAVGAIQQHVRELNAGQHPASDRRNWGYPVIAMPINPIPPSKLQTLHSRAYGWPRGGAGLYASEVTRPDLFRQYWLEELTPIVAEFNTELLVGQSRDNSIPVDFALSNSGLALNFGQDVVWEHFQRPSLQKTAWEYHFGQAHGFHRLSHFEAMPTDLAVSRFRHYTKTDYPERFVLYTNFKNHLVPFIEWGKAMQADPNSGCIGMELSPGLDGPTMFNLVPPNPAVHVRFANGSGLSMIDVGVGAPNIWKMTDCVAAFRPYCVTLLGICGGLRQTQRIGMYVLAQDFANDSLVAGHTRDLDGAVVNGEMQEALTMGICKHHGIDRRDRVKRRELIEKVGIWSTNNRGWEFRQKLINRYTGTTRGAIEMESHQTLHSCAVHCIPAAFCGLISDRPDEGDFRLPGTSEAFFSNHTRDHVHSAIKAWEILREDPADFQSRGLRENRNTSPLR